MIPSDDVRAALELDAVDHQHREAHVVEAPCHQRLQVLARAGDELAANRRLRGRAGVSLDLLADRLLGAREATRRDASEHPLEHHARERVAIGEVAVGGQRYLVASIGAARPRALDRHPAATERHLAGLVPVADGDTIRVVLAPRPDDLTGGTAVEKVLVEEVASASTDSASSPSFAAPASSPSASCTRSGSTEPGAIVHTDGLQPYRVLAKHGYDHRRRPQSTAAPGEQLLPRAHRAISNLKAWMHGTHRGVGDEHLPIHLDELRVPPQPPRHPDGRLPDAPGPRRATPPHDLRPDHPTSRLSPLGVNRIRTSEVVSAA